MLLHLEHRLFGMSERSVRTGNPLWERVDDFKLAPSENLFRSRKNASKEATSNQMHGGKTLGKRPAGTQH